ncbi:MAG: phytoene/squalene synthase family protein, partial [Silvanigrellaceae bacterium]|nr:phytoene/squalene synthase family protein [Silvanigrellaceae bacterium]
LQTQMFGELNFPQKIESAPFYVRLSNIQDNIIATLEFLDAKKLRSKINQILMGARINIVEQQYLLYYKETNLSFNEIIHLITKINGKSFYYSSFILKKQMREYAYFLYAICRIIDDATDELFFSDHKEGSHFSQQLIEALFSDNDSLDDFPELLSKLQEKLSFCTFYRVDMHCVKDFYVTSKQKIKEIGLNFDTFYELIAGQKSDENFSSIRDFAELYKYCFRVAGVVGLMMAKIFAAQENTTTMLAAERLGIAMQLTNILRDVKEDFASNRVYLPQDLLVKYNIVLSSPGPHSKIEASASPGFAKVVIELSNLAVDFYQASLQGTSFIPSLRGRLCVKLMIGMYGAILGSILKNPFAILEKRLVISKIQKLWIFLQVFLGRNPISVAKLKKTHLKG